MRTVVIKEIGSMVDDYSVEEIKNNVEDLNTWAKVSEIVKMPTTSKMLKIQFESTHMAQKALQVTRRSGDPVPENTSMQNRKGDICETPAMQ